MGQIPDPDYDPEARDPRCYYKREDRLALPNAPEPLKQAKSYKRITTFVIILIVAVLFLDPGSGKRELRSGNMASVEYTVDQHIYKLSREVREGYLEASLSISRKNDDSFRLPWGVPVYLSFEAAAATSRVVLPPVQEGIELPLHIFFERIPYRTDTGEKKPLIRVRYAGGAGIPAMELVLE